MTALRWGSATDVGRRRNLNQDSYLALDGLFVVADGMGGHAAGEVASLTAVEALRAVFRGGTTDDLADAVVAANEVVWNRASTEHGLRGMGTTLCAVAPVEVGGEERLAVVNVGDSRVYLMRDGEISQLTEDHSVPEQLLRAGEITAEEAAVHPLRHQVTRVIGQGPVIQPDAWDLVPYRGDRVVLCSDGLSNEVPDDEIAAVLRREPDPNKAARELVDMANAHGGLDNITVVIIDVIDDDDSAGRASATLDTEPSPPRRTTPEMTRAEHEAEVRVITAARGDEAELEGWQPAAPEEREVPARRFTWRTAVFLLALVVLLVGAAGAIVWYARGTYFVGLDRGEVTIFKGRPGGFLWFNPTVEQRTDLRAGDVAPARIDALEAGKEEPTRAAARRYIANLREEAETTGSTTTSTSTTSALPPGGTTSPP